jgi:rod shape-determining protein MreC
MSRFLKEHKKAIVFSGLMFVQAALLSLQIPLNQKPSLLERAAFAVLAPIQRGFQIIVRGAGGFWERHVDLRRVEARNRALSEELFLLRQENLLLRNGLRRLENQQDVSEFLRGLGRAFLPAGVIGVDAVNPYKSIIIDRGARHGLRNFMPVVDGRGRLVGRIIEPISDGEAVVQLITDDNSAVSVAGVLHPVPGLFSGDARTGRGWLKYIEASDRALAVSEALITTGFDKVFPPGLPVGTIISIQTDGSLFKKILVQPAFDFRELSTVAVLTGPAPGRD